MPSFSFYTRTLPTLPHRGRRYVLGALLLVTVFLALPWALGLVRAEVLPGVTVGGTPLDDATGPALRDALEGLAAARAAEPVTVRRESSGRRSGRAADRVVATKADVGYLFDVDATLAAVRVRGRQRNPIAAWRDHLRSFGGRIVVAPAESVDGQVLREWAREVGETLALDPIEGAVRFEGASVVRTRPEPGSAPAIDQLVDDARQAALATGPGHVTLTNTHLEPEITAEAVTRAAVVAEQVVSGEVRLRRGKTVLVLAPATLGQLVTFQPVGTELVPTLTAEALEAVVGDGLTAAFERDPADADFVIDGDTIRVSGSQDGFAFDMATAADQILELATSDGRRSAILEGKVTPAARTTEEVESLEITEQVASFTTYFQAGQSRVVNIHRIADLVDGVVLERGETFSVNGHVGERTEAKGFVKGGAILRGEFVEQVGGGVSQFATALYNAAYFGGYQIVEHRPHSYYIERYPPGREATLNYPTIDLKIRNDSPHGLLITTDYTETSLTVSVWGTAWVGVDSVEDARTRIREGDVRDGFDIVVTRVLRYPDGRERSEQRHTRYLPEDEPDDELAEDAADEGDDEEGEEGGEAQEGVGEQMPD